MKVRNKVHIIYLTVLMICACIFVRVYQVKAEDSVHVGWVRDSQGFRYIMENGEIYATGKAHWKTIEGKIYFIREDGYRKTGALTYNGKKYFLDKAGVRVTEWMKNPANPSSWYYFDPKGGYAVTGSRNIKGKYYFFRSNGVRVDGFYKSGSDVYLTSTKSGAALSGLQKASNGKTYYLDKKGHALCGFQKTKQGEIRYFDPATRAMKTGKFYVKGKMYLARTNGALYINCRPLAVGGKFYDVSSSGAAKELTKAEYYAEKALNQVGWNLKAAFDYTVSMSFREIGYAPDQKKCDEYYACYGFQHGNGHCYVYAAVFYKMAKVLGYDATLRIDKITGIVSPTIQDHGWVEIRRKDGKIEVYDPALYHSTHRGYRFQYGAPGTYQYHNMGIAFH